MSSNSETKCMEININLMPEGNPEKDIMKAWQRDWRSTIDGYKPDGL
jgi:hypothetical protein